ncbi:hypothetical protein LXL04_005767 [Taraxacum kok-saghyz]
MESACVYEETAVIHELTQGIEMANQLRLNLNSAEARKFFIEKILSSYEKALSGLISTGQPRASPQLPKSQSPQTGEIQFDRNVVSKKRKASTPCSYNELKKCLPTKQLKIIDENPIVFDTTHKGIHTGNNVAQLAPPPPPSPEKHETKPTNHHHHEISSPNNSGETLSNLRENLSVNTWDLGAIFPSSFSFPSTPFGFNDDDFESLNFTDNLGDELLQGYSPDFISPATSESNYLTEYWGSSSTLEFPMEPAYVYPDFEFNNSFLL